MKETLEYLEDELRETARELAARARYLAGDMTRLAEKIQKEGVDANINNLGEVQSSGSAIDNLIGRLAAYRDAINKIKSGIGKQQ